MDIITAHELTVGYGRTEVLRDISFAVPEGLITAVVGVSGSGKSTLLKTLAGLLPPLGGAFDFAGCRVDYRSEASLSYLYGRIGVLYQDGALLNGLSLYENVALPVRMHYPELPEDVVRDMVHAGLAQVEMADSAEKFPSELSGRHAQDAGPWPGPSSSILSSSSATSPRRASTRSRRPSSTTSSSGLRRRFKMTLVVVTHELRSIERVADRVLLLSDGGIRFSGDYAGLAAANDDFIRTFFLRKDQP